MTNTEKNNPGRPVVFDARRHLPPTRLTADIEIRFQAYLTDKAKPGSDVKVSSCSDAVRNLIDIGLHAEGYDNVQEN